MALPQVEARHIETLEKLIDELNAVIGTARAAGAYVVVTTHSHALDFTLIEKALARDDWRYVGLIGSRSKRAQFERRLAARGRPSDGFARVRCPIGVQCIQAGTVRLEARLVVGRRKVRRM